MNELIRGGLVLLSLGLGLRPAGAQPVALRPVQQLARVAPPPGGLVPYRRGTHWGYADTTGRVVIEPVLLAAPPFSPAGFVRIDTYYSPSIEAEDDTNLRYKDHYPDFSDLAQPQERLFLNARGEVLRVRPHEAAVLQPDGSLQLRPRYARGNAGQQELLDVSPAVGVVEQLEWDTPPEQLSTRRLGPPRLERLLAQGRAEQQYPPAPGRLAYARYQRVYGNIRIYGRCGSFSQYKGWKTVLSSQTLVDERGRRLTGYRYASINEFQHGLAVVLAEKGGYGLLDMAGREVLPACYSSVSPCGPEGAVVRQEGSAASAGAQFGIVNRQGHWVLPLQSEPLSNPDPAGLVRRRSASTGSVVFLTSGGRPAFQTTLPLREAQGFWQGRAWALTDAGPGLLDAHGRWVVAPGRYEQLLEMKSDGLYTNREDFAFQTFSPSLPEELELDGATAADYPHHDTTYLVVRRAGRYGLVSRATGREVLPCRYDELSCWLGDYGCGVRNNQPFLLAARGGRELAAGTYQGEWYKLPGRGPLFQVQLSPYRWLVVDSSGHRATALLPSERGISFLTPENLVLLSKQSPTDAYGRTQAIADTAGHVLVDYGAGIEYSGNPSWLNTVYYWGSSRERPATLSHAFIAGRPDGLHLLLARQGRLHEPTGRAYGHLQLLAGGWHLTHYQGRSLLISPEGAEYFAPEGYEWDETLHQKNRLVPFANGTASVAESGFHRPTVQGRGGLITRGGRRLWED